MGIFDKLRNLTGPLDDDDDFEDFTPKAPEKIPAPQKRVRQQPKNDIPEYTVGKTAAEDKVVNIHATASFSVVVLEPKKFEQAADIADHLREKRTVILNLEGTNKDIARRLIDFLMGVAYAQDGKMKKVAVSTYMITPYNVEIMGDLLDELESSGWHV